MKNMIKILAVGVALATSASLAYADTIDVASYCSTCVAPVTPAGVGINGATYYNGYNNNGGNPTWLPGEDLTTAAPDQTPSTGANAATYKLNPGTTWTGALTSPVASSWLGYLPSAGPGGTANPPQGFYTFTTSFTAAGGDYSGALTVMSDDTVEVILDYGTANQDILNGFSAIGTDSQCADNAPNCTTPFTDTLNNVTLAAGSNTLTFIVEQAGDPNAVVGTNPSGLDYDGVLSQTPEPSSLILLGSGLLGAAGLLFRRRRALV